MRRARFIASLFVLLAVAGLLLAQDSAPKPGKAGRGNKAKAPLAITPEREAAVLTFIQRNHVELADLLAHLKENQPAEYEQAVKDIFRTTERLATIQERDPLQYELEVAVWTAQSKVQLLSARMKMAVADDLKKELREALGAQADARLALLKHQRKLAADRLSKLDGDIARFENERERVIDRQLQLLTRTAEGGKAATKSNKKSKPASK